MLSRTKFKNCLKAAKLALHVRKYLISPHSSIVPPRLPLVPPTHRSGMLSRTEFKNCLKAAKLGLTRKDINLIMSTVDANKDGSISYEEFVPICFQVQGSGV